MRYPVNDNEKEEKIGILEFLAIIPFYWFMWVLSLFGLCELEEEEDENGWD